MALIAVKELQSRALIESGNRPGKTENARG